MIINGNLQYGFMVSVKTCFHVFSHFRDMESVSSLDFSSKQSSWMLFDWLLCIFSSIFPSPDQELNPSVLPAAHNTGGSLPDLTNIQFPPPLSTPLDPEDTVSFPSLSSANSTGSLTTNLTHLGISAGSHGENPCCFFYVF